MFHLFRVAVENLQPFVVGPRFESHVLDSTVPSVMYMMWITSRSSIRRSNGHGHSPWIQFRLFGMTKRSSVGHYFCCSNWNSHRWSISANLYTPHNSFLVGRTQNSEKKLEAPWIGSCEFLSNFVPMLPSQHQWGVFHNSYFEASVFVPILCSCRNLYRFLLTNSETEMQIEFYS